MILYLLKYRKVIDITLLYLLIVLIDSHGLKFDINIKVRVKKGIFL